MSGWIVLAIVVAIGFVAYGLQALSRQLQRQPVDIRRPDPLIDVSGHKAVTMRPSELHQLVGIVANAMISDAAARADLQPVLDELGAGPVAGETERRRGRRRRSDRIEVAIAELERRWGLTGNERPRPGGGDRIGAAGGSVG